MRIPSLVSSALLAVATACVSYSPPGTCEVDSDCDKGLSCQQTVCVGCRTDLHCDEWQACNVANGRCELREENCERDSDCDEWQFCGMGHSCLVRPSRCDTDSDCSAIEACGNSHQCHLRPGRCQQASQCPGPGIWGAVCTPASHCAEGAPVAGNDVLLLGTLAAGALDYDALSPIGAPSQVSVGFGTNSLRFNNLRLRSSGTAVYGDQSGPAVVLRKFVPDPLRREGNRWQFPSMPQANDPQIPTTACSGISVASFVLRAGSDAVAYSCAGSNDQWFDPAGQTLLSGQLMAWNGSDYLFAQTVAGKTVIVSPASQQTELGSPFNFAVVTDARASGDGFLVAVSEGSNVDRLYFVDQAGTVTPRGSYSPIPDGMITDGHDVIDQAGNLYVIARIPGPNLPDDELNEGVFRRTPDGTIGTFVYRDDLRPAGTNDFVAESFSPWNIIYVAYLVRGP